MKSEDKEAFEKWSNNYISIKSDIVSYMEEAWQAAIKHKQKEIDNLINASKLEFDKWYSDGMRKEFFEEKRAYDLYYNYTKDVCTYRNLAAVKEKNDALNLAKSYKLFLEKLQAENDELTQKLAVAVEALEFYASAWEHIDHVDGVMVRKAYSYDKFEDWHSRAKEALEKIRGKE